VSLTYSLFPLAEIAEYSNESLIYGRREGVGGKEGGIGVEERRGGGGQEGWGGESEGSRGGRGEGREKSRRPIKSCSIDKCPPFAA
jgi:hypothetical protein